jgi:glutathione-specific gamma-glutamylcyclotransferase
MKRLQITLTPELVALAQRHVEDENLDGHIEELHSEADYAEIVDRMLAIAPDAGAIWIFAYGSLIWKPEVDHVEEQIGVARGWHRSFCFRMDRYRGTKEKPGLMMALDRGGQCQGVLFRLAQDNPKDTLRKLFRREFTIKPANSVPRWIKVETENGPLNAIAFVMNRQSPLYVGRLTFDQVAEVLATACGGGGSGAEYLHNTVTHLAARDIYDSYLWRLQDLVAQRLNRSVNALAEQC